MSWIVAAAAGALALVLIAFSRRRPRAPAEAVVSFELRLPSKWAAELTARTLDNEGVPAEVLPAGKAWACRVRQTVSPHPANIQRLCHRFGMIAEARGGGCVAHRIRTAGGTEVFEH